MNRSWLMLPHNTVCNQRLALSPKTCTFEVPCETKLWYATRFPCLESTKVLQAVCSCFPSASSSHYARLSVSTTVTMYPHVCPHTTLCGFLLFVVPQWKTTIVYIVREGNAYHTRIQLVGDNYDHGIIPWSHGCVWFWGRSGAALPFAAFGWETKVTSPSPLGNIGDRCRMTPSTKNALPENRENVMRRQVCHEPNFELTAKCSVPVAPTPPFPVSHSYARQTYCEHTWRLTAKKVFAVNLFVVNALPRAAHGKPFPESKPVFAVRNWLTTKPAIPVAMRDGLIPIRHRHLLSAREGVQARLSCLCDRRGEREEGRRWTPTSTARRKELPPGWAVGWVSIGEAPPWATAMDELPLT
jgi:hypothetical protein